jgi:hypothetical protein
MGEMHRFVDDRLFAKGSVCVTPKRWTQMNDPVRCWDARAGVADNDTGVIASVAGSAVASISDLIGCEKVSRDNQPADYFCHRRRLSCRLSEGAFDPRREIIDAYAEAVFQPACRLVAKSGPSQRFATAGRFTGPHEFSDRIVEHLDCTGNGRS